VESSSPASSPAPADALPGFAGHAAYATPTPANPGGIKGVGQGATIAAPGAVANAVEDALGHLGVVVRATPLSPDRIWSLINEVEGTTP
jgi:CO/xanthine dehydrogenase Mo-binding subunit